jgi:hypothetical protein
MRNFKEFTFVEPGSGIEFMVDIDNSFNVIGCYTYINDIKEEWDNDYLPEPLSKGWRKGKNPIFAHNKKKSKDVFLYCVVSCEDGDDFIFLHETAKKNNFETDCILEP